MKFPLWIRRALSRNGRFPPRQTEPNATIDEAERRFRVAQLNWSIEQQARRDSPDIPFDG